MVVVVEVDMPDLKGIERCDLGGSMLPDYMSASIFFLDFSITCRFLEELSSLSWSARNTEWFQNRHREKKESKGEFNLFCCFAAACHAMLA